MYNKQLRSYLVQSRYLGIGRLIVGISMGPAGITSMAVADVDSKEALR